MMGIFQPSKRELTEEQFIKRVNGTDLNYAEMQILRRDCGLPYDEKFISQELIPDRIAALAWQKIRGRCPSLAQ